MLESCYFDFSLIPALSSAFLLWLKMSFSGARSRLVVVIWSIKSTPLTHCPHSTDQILLISTASTSHLQQGSIIYLHRSDKTKNSQHRETYFIYKWFEWESRPARPSNGKLVVLNVQHFSFLNTFIWTVQLFEGIKMTAFNGQILKGASAYRLSIGRTIILSIYRGQQQAKKGSATKPTTVLGSKGSMIVSGLCSPGHIPDWPRTSSGHIRHLPPRHHHRLTNNVSSHFWYHYYKHKSWEFRPDLNNKLENALQARRPDILGSVTIPRRPRTWCRQPAVACNHHWMECGASQYRHKPPSCPIHCNSCHQRPILQETATTTSIIITNTRNSTQNCVRGPRCDVVGSSRWNLVTPVTRWWPSLGRIW